MAQFAWNPWGTTLGMYDGPQRVSQDPNPNGIGNLYPAEHCLDMEIYHSECIYPYEIYALCAQGGWRLAYSDLRNWPYNDIGLAHWKDRCIRYENVGGVDCMIFGINRDANIYNNTGSQYGTLHVDYEVACWSSEGCTSGATHKDWMRIRAWKQPGGGWVTGHFYVDTKIDTDSFHPTIAGFGIPQ